MNHRLSGRTLAAVLVLLPNAGAGQELPTLEERGVGWTSPGGMVQVAPSGRVEVTGYLPQSSPAWIIPETDAFVAPRVSLFADVFVGSRLHGRVELRADRGEAPRDEPVQARVEQAFARWTPWAGRDLGVQAGIFASPFGGYAQRHHTEADPLVRPPLMHDYRTTVDPALAPGAAAGFVGWKDQPETFRPTGAPVVWGVPYQAGAMAFGTVRGVSFRLAVMNSAPSSEPRAWNVDLTPERGPSYVAHAAVQVVPELRLGASYNRGPYLAGRVEGPLPAGFDGDAYVQEVWGAEAAFARGRVEARAELFADRWEVPNVPDDPRDLSWYAETKVRLLPGLFAAGRVGEIRFNRIGRGDGTRARWDHDVRRWQAGAGYRLGRTTEVRAEYTRNETEAPADPRDDLFSLQWSYGF